MYQPPFNGKSKTYRKRTFSKYLGKPGIYIIALDDKIVYIGMSMSDVAEAMYRHFYYWPPHARQPVQKRVVYLDHETANYTCQIITCLRDEVKPLERGMIASLRPADNSERYDDYIKKLHGDIELMQKISGITQTDNGHGVIDVAHEEIEDDPLPF